MTLGRLPTVLRFGIFKLSVDPLSKRHQSYSLHVNTDHSLLHKCIKPKGKWKNDKKWKQEKAIPASAHNQTFPLGQAFDEARCEPSSFQCGHMIRRSILTPIFIAWGKTKEKPKRKKEAKKERKKERKKKGKKKGKKEDSNGDGICGDKWRMYSKDLSTPNIRASQLLLGQSSDPINNATLTHAFPIERN